MTDSGSIRSEQQAFGAIPWQVLTVFRGIGQVFFQENALTGALFTIGIALSSPLMATGAVIGSTIGTAVALGMKYDSAELRSGIFGFNAALVGIAAFFFFPPGVILISLMIVGCAISALLTQAMRRYLPFPTYTFPFIVTTWGVYLLAKSMGLVLDLGADPLVPNATSNFYIEGTLNGVAQVMFQGSIWTGLFFLVGIAINDRIHATLVLIGSVVGMSVALHILTSGADTIDPERLIPRNAFDIVKLGLYGYNATLAPVALFLWRKSLIAPLLGMILTVPLTEAVPLLGVPALTAPFVFATWIVLALGRLESAWRAAPVN
jgi:urea transporter